jgi:hypothetical protein
MSPIRCIVGKTSNFFHQSWQSCRNANLLSTRHILPYLTLSPADLPFQRLNEIPATLREPQGEDDTPERLEAERQAAQEFIDTGICHVGNHPVFSLTGDL